MNSSCTKKISFSHGRKLVAQDFVHFENKEWNYKISGLMHNCETDEKHTRGREEWRSVIISQLMNV